MNPAITEAAMTAAHQLMHCNIACEHDRAEFRSRKADLANLLDDPSEASRLIQDACRAQMLGFVKTIFQGEPT